MFDHEFPKSVMLMSEGDRPELDDSPRYSLEDTSRYRFLIRSTNWITTLGKFNISFAIQSLSRFCTAPRIGHLRRMLKVFHYLKTRPNGKIICDFSYPDHFQYKCEDNENRRDFYPDTEDDIPPDLPPHYGKPLRTTYYIIDANHAHCKLTRRYITGIDLFFNDIPITWISKKQKTMETSTHGSESVAARITTDLIIEVRYTLRMLEMKVEKISMLLGDNMSVVINTTIPSSILRKKHNAIAYRRVREAVASGIIKFAHIDSKENIADTITKSVDKTTFYHLTKKCLFRVPIDFNEMKPT